jgi:two-component system response regulator VicR
VPLFFGRPAKNPHFCSINPCKVVRIIKISKTALSEENMRVLICEDNKLASKTLSVVLERDGFKTDSAEDGNKAIDFLREKIYDLIVVDIHLPFHSGLELIKYLRSDLKSKTPVLIVSAFSDPQMQKQAGELGIDGYIVKPFNPSDLIEKIREILKK